MAEEGFASNKLSEYEVTSRNLTINDRDDDDVMFYLKYELTLNEKNFLL